MPVIPSVFQPIRANDYQQRPFKAYKRYPITSVGFTTESGYFRHNALYQKITPHILSDTGEGVGTRIYPVNSEDKTNQHVIWNAIDHKYYRNNTPAHAADFLDIESQQRFLWHSASMFTAPYGQVGEKIKHGTFNITSSIGDTVINLSDDGNGNLYDPIIDSTTFASSSRNFFYMSFNDMYQKFPSYDDVGTYSGSVTYKLNSVEKTATTPNGITIVPGVDTSGDYTVSSGISATLEDLQYIRVPHNDKFDRFGSCDDWTISFWYCSGNNTVLANKEIISKYALKRENYLDLVDKKRKTRDIVTSRVTSDFSKVRAPFVIKSHRTNGNTALQFQASNGTNQLKISSSTFTAAINDWNHVAVRNSGSLCQIFIDGTDSGNQSGSIPTGITANAADVMIGNPNGDDSIGVVDHEIAEVRMYDYSVSATGLTSLANRHYLSGSLYQTNTVGNVFYKNAQAVVSSPLPKYNSGSGIFGNTWNLDYRGTHTIYENECLVRVPKGQFNVTMNPTSTYRPVTVGEPCNPNQANMPPGELRKGLFISGTLKPYITTIGLYNHNAEMIATAKLAQPIQKNPDVDMNFIVRWDY